MPHNKYPGETLMKYMNRLKIGEQGRVVSVVTNDTIRRRLLDLGLIEGTIIKCVGTSPFGDPRAYLIRGAVIAIRSEDCCNIVVQ